MNLASLTPLIFAAAFVAATPVTGTHFNAAATPTHFAATNPNDYTVLMVLGDATHGARAQMLVAPFESLETSFPSGTLDDLYIEVVFFTQDGARSSGAVSFDTLLATQSEYLEVEETADDLQPWITDGNVRLPVDTSVALVPAEWVDAFPPANLPIVYHPTHVPVITPTDTANNDWAPKIQSSTPIF